MIISVMFFHGAVKNDFDTRWKSRHLVKQFMEHKVTLTVALMLLLGLVLGMFVVFIDCCLGFLCCHLFVVIFGLLVSAK